MAKTPAVLWYFNDWHGGTITLTRLMKGCYMELLHAQFNSGHLDLEEIKTVLGKDFSLWGTLSKKFSIDDEGKYFNVRLDKEINNSKKNIPKKMASSCLAGLISSTKNLRYDQIKLVKEVFNINDFIDLEENTMKKNIKEWFNKTIIEIVDNNNNSLCISSNEEEEKKNCLQPLGIEIVKEAAKKTWLDKGWLEQMCIASRLSMEELKQWMHQFNSSICNDYIHNFNDRVYKKMFVGWLSLKQSNGRKLPKEDESNKKYELKRIKI